MVVTALTCGAGLAVAGCGSECLADKGGCRDEPTIQLATCEASVDVLALADLGAVAADRVGQTVVVEGPLRRDAGACTQLGCSNFDDCCNGCGAGLLLSEDEEPPLARVGDLALSGQVDDVDLACGGDESIICCPVPVDGRLVRVTGALAEYGISAEGMRYAVHVEAMCSVE